MDKQKKARLIGLVSLFMIFGVLFTVSTIAHEGIHRQIFRYYGVDSYTHGAYTFGNTDDMKALSPDDRREMMGLHSQLETVTYIIDMVMFLTFIILTRRYVV